MPSKSSYPFRVFANQNLGTQFDYTAFTGEWLSSKGTGQSPTLPEINLTTGNVILKSTFVKTQEQIGNWEFGFVYNAQNTTPWSANIPGIIPSSAAQLQFRERDGSLITYSFDATQNAYVSPSGSHSTLLITKQADNSFIQVDPKTGACTLYDANGNITFANDARGLSMSYAYDDNNELQTITSAAGVYTIKKTSSDVTLLFTKTGEENNERLGLWTFDSQSRLQSAVIPGANDYTINYAYNGATNQLTSVTQTDGTSVHLNFSADNKLETLQQGSAGPQFTFNYAESNANITDALGFVTTATMDDNGRIFTFEKQVGDTTDKTKSEITLCTYKNNNIETIAKANNAQTQFTFNTQRLITQRIDPEGQTTQYDYDPNTFARIIKRKLISGSGDNAIYATTRYVYHSTIRKVDGLPIRQLAFVISPQGAVTEYRYDASNQLASKRTYLQNTYDLSELSPTTPLHYADMTTWAAAQPANIISLSTFTENNRGQCTEAQTFTEINADGTGKNTKGASDDQFENHTIWGGAQTHIQKMDVNGGGYDITATTKKTFDDLHRLISDKNALKEKRTIAYNDADQNCVVTEPNGRTETATWNNAGQITSTATSILSSRTIRTKSNNYDSAGHVTSITNIDGQITYQLFDSLNRLRFTITPTGRVTEHFYDDVNRYQGVTNYFKAVATNSFSTLNPPTFAWLKTNLVNDTKKRDVTTYQNFDLSNRLRFEIDGRGAVIEHRYDLQNREMLKITYALQITPDEISALKKGTFSRNPAASDSVNVTFYDNDNHIIATQDPTGYVTTYQRNPVGHLNYQYTYATPIPIILNNTLVLPAVNAASDYAKYFYTDAKGQANVVVDAVPNANYITQQTFYPTGKINTESKYANQALSAPTLQSDPTTLIPASNPENQITQNKYDLLNRLTEQHLPEMRLHTCAFDNMGNEILNSVGDDPAQLPPNAQITTQSTAKQFDDWGQLTAEAPPLVYGKIAAIENNSKLTPAQIVVDVAKVWADQSLRYKYDDATGLHTAKIDIVPDDADPTKPATTFYYCDLDRRNVLTVGPEGQASTTQWHPAFDKPLQKHRYAEAISTSGLTGGFINPTVQALLIANTALDPIDNYLYDGCGGEINHVDPDGFETQTTFNMFGNWDSRNSCVDSTTPTLTTTRTFDLRQLLLTEIQTANGKSIATINKTRQNLHGHCDTSTDGNGAVSQFTFEPRGTLLTSTDPLNHATTFAHDAFERETLRTLPMGQSIQHKYMQGSRQLKIKHLDGDTLLSETADTYDAFKNVLTHQDAEGNVTQSFYNLANQCEITIDPLDNQYKKIFDLRGLLRKTNFRQSDRTLYNTTSELDYTLSRNCASETQDSTGLNLKTDHTSNALNQRVQTTTPSGNVHETVFNKRSLATEHHKKLDDTTDVITAQNYNGQHKTNTLKSSTTDQSHIYHEKSVCDDFGRKHKRIVDPNTLALTHTTELDNANRLIAMTDPKGQTTYVVRDAIGNIRFEINPKGGVTEHRYNAVNKPIFTAQYITVIDMTKVSVGMSEDAVKALLTKNDYDRHTYYFYDESYNERFRINHAGAVTETRYDLNREKIASVQYYTPITTDPTTLTTAALITQCASIRNVNQDKASFRVLDALGQEVFIINADGSVIQKCYHSALHQVNHEIQYAIKVANPEALAQLSIAEITAQLIPNEHDRHTYWMVDSLNRLQFHVNAKGTVARYDYDDNTKNRAKITEFAAAIKIPAKSYSALLTQLNTLTPTSGVDNIETRQYDAAEREITRKNGLGKSESFGYDGASRRSQHTTLSGHTWNYEFDGASRLWRELSPKTTVYAASINPADVTEITITPSTAPASVEKKTDYDKNSNVIDITSGVGLSDEHIVNFAYNELNLKTQDTWNNVSIDDPTQKTSLTVRPETVQTVSKTVLHGAHGAKLIEFNEAGNPTFYAYNAEGQLRYKINAEGYVTEYRRNSFGECECFIAYKNKLPIDLSLYQKTGLTPDVITNNLVKDPTTDRSYHQTFDQNGKVTQIQRDPVVCYIPNANPSNAPTVATQTPTKQHVYNTFGEQIALCVLVDQTNNISRQTFMWYDKLGNEIATLDANGKAIINTFDARGKEIKKQEYANAIPADQMPTTPISFSQLQTLLASIADTTRDHITKTNRDIIGNITDVIHVGVITQQAVPGQQAFADQPAADLDVKYTYTDDGKIKSITYPDGQVKINYYDERRYLVATAEVVRTQSDGTKIRPITYHHVSIHGEKVETYKPKSGCAIDLDPTSEALPVPLKKSDQDNYHRFMRDPRGHILVKQDPENNLQQMTHTATGKIARQYKPTTCAAAGQSRVTHCDEKQNQYDKLDRKKSSTVCRDGVPVKSGQLFYEHDAFNLIGEGSSDGVSLNKHQYDQAGRKWSTVDSKAGVQLIGNNAAGEQTLEVESLTQDLSAVTYSGLQAVMGNRADGANYEFTETIRDSGGRPNAFVEPGYPDPANPANIIRPVHQLLLDNFNKKTQTVTPAGEVTTFTRNKLDKLATQTDPAIEVVDEHKNKSTVSAETVFGYNNSGGKIGVRDANNHTELLTRDEANQVVSHTAGDGTPYFTKKIDVYGNDIEVTSASGNTWKKKFNRKNKVEQVVMPSGDIWNFELNENNFVVQVTPPANGATGPTQYAQGPFGDMEAHYLPMGEAHLYEHDRHHQELLHSAFDNKGVLAYSVKHQRDFWGKWTDKTDGSGSTYKRTYYNNGMLYQELGISVTNHGEMPIFDSTTQTFTQNTAPMPLKNITYEYLTSLRLQSITDANTVRPQKLVKTYDITRNPISITETNGAGNLLRQTAMTYNARHWPVTQTDINFLMTTDYDPVGNRRRMNAICNGITHDGWWTQDAADRVLVNDGQMIGGVIQSVFSGNFGYFAPSQGNTFGYGNGLRVSQSLMMLPSLGSHADTNPVSASFTYDCNDAPSNIATELLGSSQKNMLTSSLTPAQKLAALPPEILPVTGVIYLATASSFKLASFIGVRSSGTAAFAVRGSEFIPGNFIGDSILRFFIQQPLNDYGCAIIENYNGNVYQGFIRIPQYPGTVRNRGQFFHPEALQYTPDGLFSAGYMNLSDSAQFILNRNKHNKNGDVCEYYKITMSHVAEFESGNINGPITVTYPSFNADRYPINYNLTWTGMDKTSINDAISYCFYAFDTTVISNAIGTRTDRYRKTKPISCPYYYDANTALNAVANISNPFNPNDQNPNTLFLVNSLDGRLLAEYSVSFTNGIKINAPTFYYYDARRHLTAEYGMVSNSAEQTEMALQITANPVTAFNVSNISNQTVSAIIQIGDDWKSLSYRMYRDPNYASILHAYSGVPLVPGQVINGKQTMDAYNKARDYTPYQKLMDVIYNSLNPALKTPQPPPPPPAHHESFWDEIIGIVVAVVTMIVVPEAAGFLFGALNAIETGLVFAVAGALADAETQGVAIAFNDQHGFSIKEMFENAMASGATAGLGKALGIPELLSAKNPAYLKAFSESVGIGLTVQVAQMAAGLRSKLDIKSIIEQAAAQVISAKINNDSPKRLPSPLVHGADELANTAVNAAFGGQVDLTNLAGNYLGDEAADGADYLGKKIKSQRSTSIGKASKPTGFSDKIHSVQTASRFISPEAAANDANFDPDFDSDNDNGISDLYTAYKNGLSDNVAEIAEANYSAAQSSYQHEVENHRAVRVQQRATHNASSPGLFGRVERDVDAVGQWTLNSLNTDANILSSMNPFNAMYEAANGYDPMTGQSVDLEQAYENFGTSTAALFGAEIGGAVLGVGARIAGDVLPSVSKNIASMFGRGETIPKFITTPYGKALQSESSAAISARDELADGAWIYRGGKLGKSAGPEGQFWSLENPLNPGYAEKYGLPIENTQFDFVEVAALQPGSTFITREAPGIGINGGGGIEVVVNAGEPKLKYFHMPWEPKYDSVEQRFVPKN